MMDKAMAISLATGLPFSCRGDTNAFISSCSSESPFRGPNVTQNNKKKIIWDKGFLLDSRIHFVNDMGQLANSLHNSHLGPQSLLWRDFLCDL